MHACCVCVIYDCMCALTYIIIIATKVFIGKLLDEVDDHWVLPDDEMYFVHSTMTLCVFCVCMLVCVSLYNVS